MKSNLSTICDYAAGRVAVKSLTRDNYISTENMLPDKAGIVKATSLPTVETTQAYQAGDVLVSNIRPYFKKIWFADRDGGCSNDVLVFRAKKGVSRKYLYYVLSDDQFFTYSMATSKGTKMPRGDKTSIMQYQVEEHDTTSQDKIAAILESMDSKIAINSAINDNLQQQAQALYARYFPYAIGDPLPDGWRVATVGEIIELHDSKRIPLSGGERERMTEKRFPYYGATSLMDYVDDYIFDGIFLLLGEDGTVVDQQGYPILQYVWGKFWVNNHAHILTGKLGHTVESLFLLFKQTSVQSIVTGAVQPKISQANLRSIRVVLPPEQLLNEFNELIAPIFAQRRSLEEQNASLIALRDTVLPRLMSGEIDVSSVEI